MASRTKNALKNTIWAFLSDIILMVMPFIIRAIIIRTIGLEFVGLNSLFTSVFGILNLAELGIGSTIVYSMYRPIAEKDEGAICALINLYKKAYYIIGGIITVCGLCLMPFIDKMIAGDIPHGINIYALYVIFLINATTSYFAMAYKSSLLYAHQRNDIISKMTIIANIFVYGLQIFLLCVFRNYYCYVLLIPVCSFMVNILNAWSAKKLYPQYYCHGRVDDELRKDIYKRIQGLMLDKIAFRSRNGLDSIVLSAVMGLTALALYNSYYTISSAVSRLVGIFVTSLTASLGNSIVTETKEKNEKDFQHINFLYMTITGFCFLSLIAVFQPFIYIWLGDKALLPDNMMIMISCYFLIERSSSVSGQYHDAAGLWWYSKWKSFIEAGANVILNIILCKFFGIMGIVCATVITILFIGLPLLYYYNYKYCFEAKFGYPLFRSYIFLVKFIFIGITVYFITSKISYSAEFSSVVISMMLRLILSLFVGAVLYFFLFFRDREFKQSLKWLFERLKYVFRKD